MKVIFNDLYNDNNKCVIDFDNYTIDENFEILSKWAKDVKEYGIFNYADFLPFKPTRFGLVYLSEVCNLIEEYGDVARHVLNYCNGDIEKSQSMLDRYMGQYQNTEEYVRDFLEENFDIPDFLFEYIDFQKYADDFNSITAIENQEDDCVYIFNR